MRRKKLLTGLLTVALLIGSISPVGVVGAEVPEEVRAEQLVMFGETEMQKEEEEAITAEEDVKSVEADENGFVIEDGVLTGYSGSGGDITIPDGVTSIGDSAFEGCSSLTSITIPNSVTSIGGCAFDSCSGLTSIIIPASVVSIGWEAFIRCNNLTSITIPASVTSIGNYAFNGCSSLTVINVSGGNKNYISENGILYNADKSILIQCPGGKTGDVTIPNDVTSIEVNAFNGCSSLTSITIPNSVTSIGAGAFIECSSLLTSITIPASVTSIGNDAFNRCSSLTVINVSEGNKNYISENGILYNADKSILIQCPGGKTGDVTIPDDVRSIGDDAFEWCSNLTSITIPNSVRSIGDGTFCWCSNLTSIIIPDSVRSIGDNAFNCCSSLTRITIPDSVTSIGGCAFSGCGTGFIIYCVENSYAEIYAKENNIKYRYIGEKDTQIITVNDNITRTYGDSAFSISASTDGDGVLSYVSDNETVAKVDTAGNVTLTGAGIAHITITASETDTYKAAKKIITITIEKKSQTITASDITKTFGDAAFSLNATVDGDGTLTYVSDNISIATIDSAGTITLIGAGTAHITITASETDTYKAAEKVITITVGKKSQIITASDITKTFGDAAFSLNAAVDGDGALTYVSDNTSVATVDTNGIVTLVDAGTTHITIKASETANYKAAEKIITVTVNPTETPSETPSEEPEKNVQTITAKDITKTYGDKPFSLGAKTNGGGKLTYKISNTKIASIDKKGKVTIKGCGRTQIKITAAANGNYQKATKNITLTVKPKKVAVTSVKSTKSKALTVKWKQDKKAKGYIVECSTDKKFKKNVKTVTISKNSTVSKTITKLKGGKKYYVRVCAYTTADGKKVKGNYSKVMNVKVKK